MSTTIDLASPDKKTIQRIFDTIAVRYDFINNLLSFRLDEHWRKKSRDLVLDGNGRTILDLGVGTGKFLQLFLKRQPWKHAVGIDFSGEMLRNARLQLPSNVHLIRADFHALPFPAESFDTVVSSFALRSVKEMPVFLREVYRLLTDGGKTAFLCLTRPRGWFWKFLYYPYLNWYLPFIGKFFSGDQEAYKFLSQSIQTFQSPTKTVEMMVQSGFRAIQVHSFSLGAATLIVGKK